MSDSAESFIVVETPRDAFQGLKKRVTTAEKINWHRKLITAGFRHIEIGSFVSPKAVPQMADTAEVLKALTVSRELELMALIVNARGIEQAAAAQKIKTVSYPFSCSSTFLLRNIGQTPEAAQTVMEDLFQTATSSGLDFLVYLSMAFGNPYGEYYAAEKVYRALSALQELGIRRVALSDTIGIARPVEVETLTGEVLNRFPEMTVSLHLHARYSEWRDKVAAGWQAGCRIFDSAIGGLGGCPFAEDTLLGNIPTEGLLVFAEEKGCTTGIDADQLAALVASARQFD